ncbi:MAG: hypothetical protein EXR58_06565 [Chloroflexi bacterium]|nr:hypothetical protein [Chloroflexota bacterium]
MSRAGRPVITLTTDFGLTDSFVGTMKGVIISSCPEAQIVDICHDVPPQDVLAGAIRLAAAASYFPPGTVHLAVVDPGVGGPRRPIAIHYRDQFFVGPDNGMLCLATSGQGTWEALELTNQELWLKPTSSTFHGRDIFAPIAAYLAGGADFGALGSPIKDPVALSVPQPDAQGPQVLGSVIDVDRFGNLITNIRGPHLKGRSVEWVEVQGQRINGLSTWYDPSQPLIALIASDGWIEVAAPLGNAAQRLGVGAGESVTIRLIDDLGRSGR